MHLIQLLLGRLCFKVGIGFAMAGQTIIGIDTPAPSFPLYHY